MIYSPHWSACNSLQARRVGEDACEFEMGDGHEGLGDGDLADLLADALSRSRAFACGARSARGTLTGFDVS